MKILLITGSLNQGGAEFQILSLARLLQSKKLDVEVLALTDYDYYLPFINENGLKYSCVSNKGVNLVRLFRAVRQINAIKPDVAISYIKRTSQVAILARILSLFRFRLIISERTSQIRTLHDVYYFNLALLTNKITVNSVSKYNYILRRFPYLKERTVFIPNLLDLKKFSSIENTKPGTKAVRLSYIGRISPEKNLLNLIRAVKLVCERGYRVTLSLTGQANNQQYLEKIEKLVSELDLGGIVKFSGPKSDVTETYRCTDLVCIVSLYEGLSNVLAEAFACGIPVIASDIEENRYLVEDGSNGFLVDPARPDNISTGIERFLSLTQDEIFRISSINRRKAGILFDQEVIYQQYRSIFTNMGLS